MTDTNHFGDYIVFVDESGDQNLTLSDTQYPVFVLSFCIFNKKHYCEYVLPEVTKLKFKYWGTDAITLHEREMRQRSDVFNILMNAELRETFFNDLNRVMHDAQYKIVSTIIDKNRYSPSWQRTPYDIATQFGLERVFFEMQSQNQRDHQIPIIFESRGKKEDRALLSAIVKIKDTSQEKGLCDMFSCECVSKHPHSIGLQFTDMIARPIGNHYLHPDSPDRAWDILRAKLRQSKQGKIDGYGLKLYPADDFHFDW